jgi:HK97 family phage major capsid protein
MAVNLKKLTERRAELMTQLDRMVQTCETETRAFNEDETKSYNEILAEVRSIDTTLDAADRAAELGKNVRPAAAVENRTAEELETRAFECYIRGILPEEETRAAVNMTTGDNGAVIPASIARKIIERVNEISPLYQRANHYDVGGTLTIPVYDESTQKITMAYATEFSALTSTSGKFTSVSLSGFLAGALTKISVSLINNSAFDIVSYVIRKMADAVADWMEGELINGTAGKITGLSGLTASVTAAAATAVTADELIDLQESIPDKLQPGCIWIMSRATRKAIRKLKDGDGTYLLNKDATAKWGYSLFGHDVYVSDAMPEMAAGAAAVLYLDPACLAVKVSENPSIQVLREKYADEHAVGVITWMEVDSKVENTQMAAKLVMAAA